MARRFDEIEAELANPAGGFDQTRYTALVRERAQLEPRCKRSVRSPSFARRSTPTRQLARSEQGELRELALEENRTLLDRTGALEDELAALMVPQDPDDSKDVFVEIRAGTGGDEAAIFAGDLARMYMRFAESAGMKIELGFGEFERRGRL